VDFAAKHKEASFKNVPDLLAVTKEQGNEHLMTGVQIYIDLLTS